MKNISSKYIKNIPNALSISRLFLIPILFCFAYVEKPITFGYILIVYGLTDTLDGIIARAFNITSDFGAKLDGTADSIGNLFIIIFVYMLFPEIFTNYAIFVWLIIGLYVLSEILLMLKLKNVGMHFYLGKLTQALLLFMVCYFSIVGFNEYIFYLWFGLSLIYLFEIILSITFFKPDSDTRTIFDLISKN